MGLCLLELAGQVHLMRGLQDRGSHRAAVLCYTFNTDTSVVVLEVLINLDFAHPWEELWQPKAFYKSSKSDIV